MPTPDEEFEAELEIFRSEGDACLQFFYAFLAVHAVPRDNRLVYRLLNEAALFWNTSLAALQGMTFIVLGRVFDQGSPHNVDRLLRLAQQHSEIFSRQALGARRQGMNETAPEWLEGYVLGRTSQGLTTSAGYGAMCASGARSTRLGTETFVDGYLRIET